MQLDDMLKTQTKMQAELTQCEAKLKAQDQLIQQLLGLLGYSTSGTVTKYILSYICSLPSILFFVACAAMFLLFLYLLILLENAALFFSRPSAFVLFYLSAAKY